MASAASVTLTWGSLYGLARLVPGAGESVSSLHSFFLYLILKRLDVPGTGLDPELMIVGKDGHRACCPGGEGDPHQGIPFLDT